ncbi:MAG TPA: squalene synthase HpnC [Stellaceae bacterium]|nr:squalene synthase HpnC [Stellaceae bacterium]
MNDAAALKSGKGHRDENFPVASFLIHPRHRAVILAFYRFARAADDIADNAAADPNVKLLLLDEMRRTLKGEADTAVDAQILREVIGARGLSAQHGLDLLDAFSLDVTKLRYRDWDDLIDYCRLSAMPVGRFVLDVHGESRATWPASDALCAALQVINHLQDCRADFRNLNRVYIPLDRFDAAGMGPESLDAPRSSPALRAIIVELAEETSALLGEAKPFASQIRDRRLALEVAVIQRLAEDLVARLRHHDPLADRVHHTKTEFAFLTVGAAIRFMFGRPQSGPKDRKGDIPAGSDSVRHP